MTHAAVDLQKWGTWKQVGKKKVSEGERGKVETSFFYSPVTWYFLLKLLIYGLRNTNPAPAGAFCLISERRKASEEGPRADGRRGYRIWEMRYAVTIPRHWGSPCGCSRVNYQRRACDSVWREIRSIRGIRERTFNEIIRDLEYRILPSIRVFAGTIRPSLELTHKCMKLILKNDPPFSTLMVYMLLHLRVSLHN